MIITYSLSLPRDFIFVVSRTRVPKLSKAAKSNAHARQNHHKSADLPKPRHALMKNIYYI